MKTITKIVCRTVGALGMGVALYDATKMGALFSKNHSHYEQEKYLEDRFFASRNLDSASYYSDKLRKKTFDIVQKNPLPAFWGGIKGACKGVLSSMTENLPLVAFSSLAILAKGTFAKVGAIGIGLDAIYRIAREGLGIGKKDPLN